VNLLRAGTMLWFLAGAALLVAAFVRMRSVATIFGVFASLLAVLVTGACYEFLFHFGRQLYIVPAAVFFVAVEQNGIFKENRGSEDIQDPKRRGVLNLCNPYGVWLVVGFILTLCWHYLRLKGKTI
jgi:hypothetical protein